MTRAERLRAAAAAERLSDHLWVQDGWVTFAHSDDPLFGVVVFGLNTPRETWRWTTHPHGFVCHEGFKSSGEAMRAGALALADRDETVILREGSPGSGRFA